MGTNIGHNISKNVSGKYRQKFLDHGQQSAAGALETTSKRITQKTSDATGDLIGYKISDRITKVWKTSPQYHLETNIKEHNKEIPKERIYLQKKDKKLLIN